MDLRPTEQTWFQELFWRYTQNWKIFTGEHNSSFRRNTKTMYIKHIQIQVYAIYIKLHFMYKDEKRQNEN